MPRASRVVEITIELDEGRWAEIECEVWPDVPMRRTGHPDTWEPAEPGEVVVHEATVWHAEEEAPTFLVDRALDWLCRGREVAIEDAARAEYERVVR